VLSEALVDNVFQGPHIIPWPDALITGRHDRLLEHEARHVRQCEVFGPLMIILYPMASLWAWVRGKGFYEGNAFEVDARKHEGGATLLAMATKLIRNESKSVGRDH
jgi:hypothetical protein